MVDRSHFLILVNVTDSMPFMIKAEQFQAFRDPKRTQCEQGKNWGIDRSPRFPGFIEPVIGIYASKAGDAMHSFVLHISLLVEFFISMEIS